MKITITPADIRLVNESLSHFAAARQWASILESAGVDVSDELEQIDANERIARGLLAALERAQGEPL